MNSQVRVSNWLYRVARWSQKQSFNDSALAQLEQLAGYVEES